MAALSLADIRNRKRALAEEAAGQRARLAAHMRTLDRPVLMVETGFRLAQQFKGVAGMVAALALSAAAKSSPRTGVRLLSAAALAAATGLGRWAAARWAPRRAPATVASP